MLNNRNLFLTNLKLIFITTKFSSPTKHVKHNNIYAHLLKAKFKVLILTTVGTLWQANANQINRHGKQTFSNIRRRKYSGRCSGCRTLDYGIGNFVETAFK